MPRNSSSIVGRTLRNPYPSGGTITILSVAVVDGWGDDGPVIECEIQWNTGNPVLDNGTTIGSLAPGSLLWSELSAAGPVPAEQPALDATDAS